MRTFRLDKLVHDGIIDSNNNQGVETDYVILTGDELLKAKIDKLNEELEEVEAARSLDEAKSEIIDLKDIIHSIKKQLGYEVDDYVPRKSFDRGFYVHSVSVPDGNWAEYYSSNPERFPEIS